MDAPLVSVCIGSYNREKYIREALDSVFAQTYPNLEVFVVDDASTDRTVEIVERYSNRVQLIRLERNSGLPAVPRNIALARAKGEFVAFLDSDDSWLPEKIEKQVNFLLKHPENGLVHCYAFLVDGEGRRSGIRHDGQLPPAGPTFSALLKHCFITMSTVMIRRIVVDETGQFSADPRFRIGEDLEWFLRVTRRWPIGFMDQPLANYRRAETGISQGNASWKSRPRDIACLGLIANRPDLWDGIVPKREVVAAFIGASIENCQYWRDLGFGSRAAWFSWNALMRAPAQRRIWTQLGKSLARCVISRGP